jgi:RHS repeat-associated protein
MAMQGRSFIASDYKFGYQGSQKEVDIKGMYTTEFRALDVRLGRWFIPDPITHPSQSPYCAMNNNPIAINDILGLEGDPVTPGTGTPTPGGVLGNSPAPGPGECPNIGDGLTIGPPPGRDFQPLMITGFNFGSNSSNLTSQQDIFLTRVTAVQGEVQKAGNGAYMHYATQTNAKGEFESGVIYWGKTAEERNLEVYGEYAKKSQNMKPSDYMNLAGNLLNWGGIARDFYEGTIFATNTVIDASGVTREFIHVPYKGYVTFKPDINRVALNETEVLSKVRWGTRLATAGKWLGGAGVVISVFQMGFELNETGTVQTSTAIDAAMGAFAFVPVVGWGVSTTYFLLKMTGMFSPNEHDFPMPLPPETINPINGDYIMPRDNTRVENRYRSPGVF